MNKLLNFLDYINDYLIAEGISVNEFSERIRIDDYTIYRWLNENFQPSLDNLIKVANFFDCSIDYMFGLSQERHFSKTSRNEDFIIRLTKLLKSKGVTQYKLAKDCSIGSSAISKWMKNKRKPKISNLITLAEYFGCSIEYLIGREN